MTKISQYLFVSIILFLSVFLTMGCSQKLHPAGSENSTKQPFVWENSTIYFLLTDRFYNADKSNDFKPDVTPAKLRGYEGGDIKGITAKVEEGYFNKLGANVLWMTPLVENIEGFVDEGTGISFGFHGYWIKDWTAIDPRLGTKEDVRNMVKAAHDKGLKVIMDVVINHTGPVTAKDPVWPSDWVRTGPRCSYKDYRSTVECTLVDNLPDILTNTTKEVEVPAYLQEKWKKEGRFEQEMSSLDAFFKRTGHPRLPHFYIIKWITDMIIEYGIDGFRVDTVKHVEESVWKSLKNEAQYAFEVAKKKFPTELPKEESFFMLGELYGYNAVNGPLYDFGDKKVDYYINGFDALINFGFVWDAKLSYTELFKKYDGIIQLNKGENQFVHYVSSHDDGNPYDKKRERVLESGTKLMLTPGMAQIYYGDEIGRTLTADATGDAQLRSAMDWKSFEDNDKMIALDHWQKLGQFRINNPAVGAGKHVDIDKNVFGRMYQKAGIKNTVVFALEQQRGEKLIPVKGLFKDGEVLYDYYSKGFTKVEKGMVKINNPFQIVLLGKKNL
ncbi:MAG: alpha-amylase [Saprospiraceae bacterium]|nr:alpha-amylase [Saprospiraceae bacterium]